jgi:hypothetical protein
MQSADASNGRAAAADRSIIMNIPLIHRLVLFFGLLGLGIQLPLNSWGGESFREDYESYNTGYELASNVYITNSSIAGHENNKVALFTSGGGELTYPISETTAGIEHISFDLAIVEAPKLHLTRPIETYGSIQLEYSGLELSMVDYYEYLYPVHHEYFATGDAEIPYTMNEAYSFDYFVDFELQQASMYMNGALIHEVDYNRNAFPAPIGEITFRNSRESEFSIDNFAWTIVPEPETLSLFIISLLLAFFHVKRKKTKL